MSAAMHGEPDLDALSKRLIRWLERVVARQEPLTFRDLRKGVQALSSRYVEGRGEGRALAQALDGPARRGAFASYYAALHLIQAFLAAQRVDRWDGIERIVDLGAGTGAAGFGAALSRADPPVVRAFDRSGWALAEARATARDLGLSVRTRKQDLARGLPRLKRGDLVVAGWFLNELEPAGRNRAVLELVEGRAAGARVLLIEPLAGAVAPWWEEVAARLGLDPELSIRERIPLPGWVRDMDRASGLDHGELRARIMGDVG